MIEWFTLLFVVLFYTLFEVNYFLRMFFEVGRNRLFHNRTNIFEKNTIYGICLPSDVDIFLNHMNNARYLREADFTRTCFYDTSGIWTEIVKRGGSALLVATSIRYRRAIPVFSVYKVTTKLVYWDDKNIYIEHEFSSISENFVYATALSKQRLVGPKVYVPEIIENIEPNARKPELNNDLRLWIDFLEESSLRYKSASTL